RAEVTDAQLKLRGCAQALRREQPFEGGLPALVVRPLGLRMPGRLPGPDLLDQARAELLPREDARPREREREAEEAALPRRDEAELSVAPRRRGRAVDVQRGERGLLSHAGPLRRRPACAPSRPRSSRRARRGPRARPRRATPCPAVAREARGSGARR